MPSIRRSGASSRSAARWRGSPWVWRGAGFAAGRVGLEWRRQPSPSSAGLLAERRAQGLLERLRRLEDGGGLIAAVGHAVVATRIATPAVLLPLRGLHELLVGLRVAVGHQVARSLPAEDRVARDPPRGALEVHLALEEVQEERSVIEAPLLALAVSERLAEELVRFLDPQEVVLVRRLLVGVGRRDHHLVDLELIVDEVEDLTDGVRRVMGEEGGVRRHAEALRLRRLDRRNGLLEDALALHRRVVALAHSVQVDRPGEVRGGLEEVELLLHQERVRAQVDELLARDQLAGDLVDLGMDQRLAARDRDHWRAALLDRPDRLVDWHPPAKDVVGMLDLAAAGAREVALIQRLELHEEGEFLPPGQALPGEVRRGPEALSQWNCHTPVILSVRPVGRIGHSR